MKKLEKRLISVVLVLAMLATMFRMSPAEDKISHAETAGLSASGQRLRGNVNSITELPQYGRADHYALTKGTKERPFVVLEIVPYKAYAEIGYLIGGCEPIDLTYRRDNNLMGVISSLHTAYMAGGDTRFFLWEPEAQDGMFDQWNETLVTSGEANGYFERVSSGGQFRETYEEVTAEPSPEPESTQAPEQTSQGAAVSGEVREPIDSGAATGAQQVPQESQAPEQTQAPQESRQPQQGQEGESAQPQSQETGTEEVQGAAAGHTVSVGTAGSGQENGLVLTIEQTAPQESAPGAGEASAPEGAGEAAAQSQGMGEGLETAPQGTPETQGDGSPAGAEPAGQENAPAAGTDPAGNGDNGGTESPTPSPESASPEIEGDAQTGAVQPQESVSGGDELPQGNVSDGNESQGSVSGGNVSDGNEGQGSVSGGNVSGGDVSGGDELPKTLRLKIERAENNDGTLIWHTINEAERQDRYPGVDFSAYDKESEAFAKAVRDLSVGGRIYTTLTCDANNPMKQSNSYQYYRNHEHFLRLALGLSEEQAAAYSIVVKTITPEELNQTPEWTEYADLFYLSPQSHMANGASPESSLPGLYVKYNGLSGPVPTDKGFDSAMGMKDLSWDVVERMYRRITADENYAAILLDDTIAIPGQGGIQGTTVPAAVYDFNLEKTSWQAQNITVSACNVYKLWVMLCSMDANLFRRLYLNGDEPLIQNGVFRLRSGETANGVSLDTAWGIGTFSLVKPGYDKANEQAYAPWRYWYSDEAWDNYHMTAQPTNDAYRYWCDGRVLTYKGDSSISQGFAGGILGTNPEKFKDVYDSLAEGEKLSPAFALRYVLRDGDDPSKEGSFGEESTLKILDLEPSVGLHADYTPDWYLKESYIRMLVPDFAGKIEITHQTTAEFIGKAEDLNTVYDMIFIGQDVSGYNLRWDGMPDWNDNTMDGKIYFHTGDSVESGEYTDNFGGTRTARWVSDQYGLNRNAKDKPGRNSWDAVILRFPGNDISRIKKAELEDYLNAGHPIVTEQYLYDLKTDKIDASSYLYQLVQTRKETGAPLYGVHQVEAVEGSLRTLTEDEVIFTGLPALYNGATNPGTSVIASPNYLPTDGGRAYLQFQFETAQPGYAYRLYVDQDHNGKFKAEEVLAAGPAAQGPNTLKYRIAASMLGLVQWKIEVYRSDNESVRYVETGCSAVQPSASMGKRQIKVLQIVEGKSDYNKDVILSNNGNVFQKYYSNLDNYNITVDSITWEEYEACFHGETWVPNRWGLGGRWEKWDAGFSYDHSKAIDTESAEMRNPVNLDQIRPISGGGTADGKALNDYNMIIIGPAATKQYGAVTMSNEGGAVDFLYYFADSGRVMLFTHDLSSMYNQTSWNFDNPFGYTVNTLMRDLMGMNRYGAVNKNIDVAEQRKLSDYQNSHTSEYDVTDSAATHGYTYGALKRLGKTNGARMPYRELDASKGSRYGLDGSSTDDDGVTNRVAKINEGPITSYPYKIDDAFQITETNVQYYQLNPEDPEVTVWYCLDRRTDTGWNSPGSTLFAVSPKDTMNNYYVYSKDNIFYSGVGHLPTVTEMEAKLFVNTMIAAYNVALEPPVIEVLNEEAILDGSNEYSIELLESFDELEEGYYTSDEGVYSDADVYRVRFTPVDFNLVSTQLSCSIQLADGVYADTIYQVTGGVRRALNADGEHWFTGLQNGQTYYLEYPKKYLGGWIDEAGAVQDAMPDIVFTVKNNRVKTTTDTTLHMDVQPLFPLD